MSRRLMAALFTISLLCIQNVWAEAALKIASVSIQKALNEVEQAQKAKAELKKEFDKRQKKLDLQQESLKKLKEELEKQRLVLSEKEMREKEESFSSRYMELQQSFMNYRNEITQQEAKMTAKIIQNLKTICEEIGKKEGYSLVVETSQDSVLYADSKADLTAEVVKLYNKRFKGPLKIDD